LFCSDDQALPVQVQEMMVDRIEQLETTLRLHRAHCTASHSPFLSMPERVVQIVERVCQGPTSMHDENMNHKIVQPLRETDTESFTTSRFL